MDRMTINRNQIIEALRHRFPTARAGELTLDARELAAMHEHMADLIERQRILNVARDAEHAVDLWCPDSELA